MESLKIKIQTKKESLNKPNPVPELEGKIVRPTTDKYVCIMEDMTVDNKSAVVFYAKLPNGEYAQILLTENIFNGLQSAYKGALQRFEDERG